VRRAVARDRSGFTLLEMSVALVLLVLVIGNVYSLLRQSSKTIGAQNRSFDIDTQAQRAMDHITMAIVGASESTLTDQHGTPPVEAPFFTNVLNYREQLGIQDGQQVTSPPQRIEYTNTTGEVTWVEKPDTSDEKRVVWSKNIPPFLLEEIANGVDDNKNGIIDETGLSFSKEGKSITVYLTVKRTTPDGQVYEKKLQDTVTCRN
jgi:prepilin-type N-terminal cleavage/methylation domain-containing protein